MSGKGAYQRLGQVIERLNDHIISNKHSPYLATIVGINATTTRKRNVTPSEAQLRESSLKSFQASSQYQKVEPAVYSELLKNLYPMRKSLSGLSSNRESLRQVNHDLLFRSYCALPRPGVAHLKYNDLENFLLQIFSFRTFSKPNSLSNTSMLMYNDAFVVKQYVDANMLRHAHLKILWQITNDLDSAKIPTSDKERQNLIFKTFFRERHDVMNRLKYIESSGHSRDAEEAKAALQEWDSPKFDFNTYKDISQKFQDAENPETLNTLLFTALRHRNMAAYSDIMARFPAESYTRGTFKILLENLAFLGKRQEYKMWISFLISRHISLVDIKLINTIISSLVSLHEPQLAESITSALALKADTPLTKSEEFLKLITMDDKSRYSSYIAEYDQLHVKPPVNFHPTVQSFLPIFKYYCETGADFKSWMKLFDQVEIIQMLPITSQMFKYIFLGFSRHVYDMQDLQHMLRKLIEAHDLNSNSRDTWIREKISDSTLPDDLSRILNEVMTEPTAPGFSTDNNNFIKLSNGLVRQVFSAFYNVLGRYYDVKDEVFAIEKDLDDALLEADARQRARITRDQLAPIDLHEREELTFLKKTSLLKLLDILP